MDTEQLNRMLDEDRRREALIDRPYDPLRGDPDDPDRVAVDSPDPERPQAFVPRAMTLDPAFPFARTLPDWERLRCRYDFEFWCARCVTVKDKASGRDMRMILNAAQRRLARIMETDRRAGRPVRIILLKARQWGGSTLIQTYMAWIQSCHRTGWHSIICSQVKDTSAGIRGMYAKILDNFPEELWPGDCPPRFKPYERSTNVREITGRGCRVTVSSIENQDAVRGADFAMAHLSEVAFWRPTPGHTPEDTIRAICGSVGLLPDTLIAMESTANGVGNYFHREWLRCADGRGDKRAVFVPWYEIPLYRLDPGDRRAFALSLDEYETVLWDLGCSLSQIYWYRRKALEYNTPEQMMAEYPTTDGEAFAATGHGVFPRRAIESMREGCRPAESGEFNAGRWNPDADGSVHIWEQPVEDASYVAAVDIGGRTASADYSVITVLRADTPKAEVVAQWRGHIDHDLLADRAVDLATFFNTALLVVESNSLEGAGGAGLYILDRLSDTYPNLYRRRAFDDLNRAGTTRVGFHTNRQTKEMIITALNAAIRLGTFVERDTAACDELLTYEQRPDGSYAAKPGCHDDMVMTRAMALYAAGDIRRGIAPAVVSLPGGWEAPPYW